MATALPVGQWPMAARMLCKYAGLRQREVATRLGLTTGAAVCLQLKRLQIALDHDTDLKKQVVALELLLQKRSLVLRN